MPAGPKWLDVLTELTDVPIIWSHDLYANAPNRAFGVPRIFYGVYQGEALTIFWYGNLASGRDTAGEYSSAGFASLDILQQDRPRKGSGHIGAVSRWCRGGDHWNRLVAQRVGCSQMSAARELLPSVGTLKYQPSKNRLGRPSQ